MSTQTIDPSARPGAEPPVREVVGPPLTGLETAIALALGVVALHLSGTMPLLLGGLAGEHRLAVTRIGDTFMAEALSMGLTTALCGALVKPERLRLIGLLSVVAVGGVDLAMAWASGWQVIGLRALSGVAEGVLLWIAVGMIARSATPERWAGVFYGGMTLCQFALTGVAAALVVPRWHAGGGFTLAGCLVLLAAPLALFGRDRYAALSDSGAGGVPPARGMVALAGSLLFAAAFGAVAVYTVPLARQAGLAPGVAGVALTAALAMQIAGSAAATALAGRISYFTVFVLVTVVSIAGWTVFMFGPPAWLFVAAAVTVGFVYMIGTPFLTPMIIEADPSLRAAVQMGGAQLFGGAVGPFLASRVVGEHDVHGAIVLAALLLTGSLGVFGFLRLAGPRG